MTNEEHINLCHPAIRHMVKAFLSSAELQGIKLKITFSFRSFETQDALYNQPKDGKDNDGDGQVDEKDEKVTNARAGQSFHNYGLAVDVVPIVNKKPVWNDETLWKKIGGIGKSCGFEWGGDWKSFKDKPHFEYPRNTRYTYLLQLKEDGKVDSNGYVIL